MANYINELERQIAEKNKILTKLSHEGSSETEKVRDVKLELDRLLYSYYKALKSKFTSIVI